MASVAWTASCGSGQFTYVENSDHQTYLKVPSGWEQVNQSDLEAASSGADPDSAAAKVAKQLNWTVAYDASPLPSAAHVFGAESEQPVAYLNVRELMPEQRDQLSLNTMRDVLLPVTGTARERAKTTLPLLGGFEMLSDEVVTPGSGLRGVHAVFNYRLGPASLQTFDQTVLVNEDTSKLYLLLVRCSASCYSDRTDELAGVVESFTVKG